jgi:hypothetical protein
MTQLTLNLKGDLEATGGTMTSSSQVASRNYANHSQWLEKEKGQMMNATYGERCFEQYKKLNRNSSLLKTSLVSQILTADWYSRRCALTWKLKGTKFSRLLFQLQPKTHRTDEIGAGLLLLKTPCTADAYTENMSKKEQKFGNSGTLAQEVQTGFIYQRGMLPTPNARDWKDTIGSGKDSPSIGVTRGYSLGQKINSFLPTPTAMDSTNATATMKSTQVKEGSMHSVTLTRYLQTGKNSQLNPRFVAEMMGFPPNWTELPFQNGGQKVSKVTETP